MAGSQFENLLNGFRATSEHCADLELIVLGCGSKGNYVANNAPGGRSSLTKEVTSSTKLADINEDYVEAMVGYFMNFLEEVRERHRNPGANRKPVLWTASPLGRGAHQYFANDGGLLPSYREAYTMEVCNSVFRGYGFRRLGTDEFPSVSLRACAGQFQYLIDKSYVEGKSYTSVACLSPLVYHQHSGVPCLLNHRLFQGAADRNLIQTSEVSPCFVSYFYYLLNFLIVTSVFDIDFPLINFLFLSFQNYGMNPRQIEYHQFYRRDLLPDGGYHGSPRFGRGGRGGGDRGGGGRGGGGRGRGYWGVGGGYHPGRGISGPFR
jgi:uncharacterized membrane protein YgcG